MSRPWFVRVEALLAGYAPSGQNPEERVSGIARELVDRAKQGSADAFPEVFQVVEDEIVFGDEENRKLILVALLENMKNFASWDDFDYVVFEQWLGAETYVAWRWLEKKWQGKHSLADTAGE